MSSDSMSTRDLSRTLKHAAKEGAREAVKPADERAVPMFAENEAEGFRARWDAIQTGFVDEPRKAVEEADSLVAQVITRLSEVFADERSNLEGQWGRGDQISTEDLRVALRKYRSFFERLLTL
jgi:5'-deoxynucleotidase YfbR-like HD superfamily hydrolase